MKRKPEPKSIYYNPIVPPERAHGYKNVRWVENVSRGLRRVGFADEIAKREDRWREISHEGWYSIDEYAGEVYRGVVYQLPSHGNEKECYVYGYADPNNDDAALLCFDVTGNKMEAARCADRFAERFAEAERNYQEAWQAGRRCEEIADELKQNREQALKLADEMRAAKHARIEAPTICATLRTEIKSLRKLIIKLRDERDELIATFGKREGFAG